MKKVFGIFAFGILLISMSLVSAGTMGIAGDLKRGISGVIEPVLEYLIGEASSTELFLAKILFLIIIFAIVWASLRNIPFFTEKEWVLWVVSIAVSLVAIRWLGDSEVIRTIILPYSVMGIAISAGLPFIISFFVIQGLKAGIARRIAWIFFTVIFIGLWFSRYDELGNFGYIYLVTAGLAFIMMTMDGTIQRFKLKLRLEKIGAETIKEGEEKILERIARLDKLRDDHKMPIEEHAKRVKKLNEDIVALHK